MKVLPLTRWCGVGACLLVLLLWPSHANAQEPWPKVVIRAGALLADVASDVRIDATTGNTGTEIDLADDLGFGNQTTTFFLDGTWRITRRNRLQVDYEGIRRDVTRTVLPRTITFRDQTFTAGSETQAFFDTFYLSVYYGFAFVATPTVEVGATIGVTVLRIHSGVALSVTGTGDTTVSRDLAESTKFDVPVPLPGFFVNIRPHRRVTIVGAARVIKASASDVTATFAELKGGVDYMIGRGVGVGGAYYFNKSVVDREQTSRNGRIEYAFNGPQAYAVLKW